MGDSPVSSRLHVLLWASAAVRLLLVLWGELQDRFLQVKYTDIDYLVFTDAARFLAQGHSPYDRSTYRYSPLLAYLLLPNIYLHGAWGKLLFSAGDILAAMLIIRILRNQRASEPAVLAAAAAWLCNPFTLTISTRGSCDVVAALLLLALLLLLQDGRRRSVLAAAAAYGLVVHLRIYPIIYAPALVLYLAARALAPSSSFVDSGRNQEEAEAPPSLWWHLTLRPVACIRQLLLQAAVFGGTSAAVFFALGAACYALHGQRFLDEAFLHHLTRRDPRHNFSPHFYPIYLGVYGHGGVASEQPVREVGLVPPTASPLASLVAELMAGLHLDSKGRAEEVLESAPLEGELMLPDVALWASMVQMLAQLVLAAALHHDLSACLLLQTMAFVALNKVCTAQYFVWYFSLIPLVLPKLPWPLPSGLKAALGCWVGCQLHWLLWGYLLEFQGLPVHLMLWGAGVLFLGANVFLMVQLLQVLHSAQCRPRGEGGKAHGD